MLISVKVTGRISSGSQTGTPKKVALPIWASNRKNFTAASPSNPQMTDATGRFGFILQTNRKYYMTAQAEGYEDYTSPVFTEQWHVLREDIEMEPAL